MTEKFPSLTVGISRSPLSQEKDQNLRPQAGARIQNHVLHTAGARRQKTLMPLIKTCYEDSAK